jgi:hypothetical protein
VTRTLATLGMLAVAILTLPGLVLVWLTAPLLDHMHWTGTDDYIEQASLVFWLAALVVFLVQWGLS